jgi:hypothetical protein
MAAHCLAHPFRLGRPDTKLYGGVAVTLFGTLSNNLAAIDLEQGHRRMISGVVEDPGHAKFLSY